MHTVRTIRRRAREGVRLALHRLALAAERAAAAAVNATSRHPRPRRLVSTDLWNG